MSEITLSLDLGPDASPAELSTVVTAIATVLSAGRRLAVREAEQRALDEVLELALESPEQLEHRAEPQTTSARADLDAGVSTFRQMWQTSHGEFEALSDAVVASALAPIPRSLRQVAWTEAERIRGAEPTIRSLQYENPLELVIAASGVTLTSICILLTIVRDWHADAQTSRAAARIANAHAGDAENRAALRNRLYEAIGDKYATGELKLTPEQILDLLGDMPTTAVAQLAASPVHLQLPEGEGNLD